MPSVALPRDEKVAGVIFGKFPEKIFDCCKVVLCDLLKNETTNKFTSYKINHLTIQQCIKNLANLLVNLFSAAALNLCHKNLPIFFLHLHEIVEGLYFHCSLSVCVCVCVSVCLSVCVSGTSCEQNSSRTDEPIWTRFSLHGCFPH